MRLRQCLARRIGAGERLRQGGHRRILAAEAAARDCASGSRASRRAGRSGASSDDRPSDGPEAQMPDDQIRHPCETSLPESSPCAARGRRQPGDDAALFRRRRLRRARDRSWRWDGRVIAELPKGDDLVLFSEDAEQLLLRRSRGRQGSGRRGARAHQRLADRGRDSQRLARRSRRARPPASTIGPEGIARDRWDVAIEAVDRR